MFGHYLSTALRNFWRFRSATLVNLVCLGLGLGCIVMAYATVDYLSHGDESLLKSERVWLVTTDLAVPRPKANFNNTPRTGPVLAEYLKTDFPQLAAVARRTVDMTFPVVTRGAPSFLRVSFADAEFLDLFHLPIVQGSAGNPLSTPRSAVITESAADRLFATRNVVGRTLRLANREDVTITAVMRELPQPTHMGFGLLASMDVFEAIIATPNPPSFDSNGWTLGPDLARWATGYETYVELAADGGLTPGTLRTELRRFADRHTPHNKDAPTVSFGLSPVGHYFLNSMDAAFAGATRTGLRLTTIVFWLAGLVLAISCLNYANLATALAAGRAKEVGLRRVVGARRSQIITQHLFEAALIGAVALVLVLLIAMLLLPVVRQFGLDVGWGLFVSPRFLGVLALLVAAVTIVGGTYPALVLSSVSAVSALRGGSLGAGRYIGRVLAVLQFSASSFLLITVFIVNTQNDTIRRAGTLFTADPLMVVGSTLKSAGVDFERLKRRLVESPHIVGVTASASPPLNFFAPIEIVARSPDPAARTFTVMRNTVSYDFLDTLGIQLLAGRDFSRERGEDSSSGTRDSWYERTLHVIVDDELATQLGWRVPSAAVGQTMVMPAAWGKPAQPMEIIGVVKRKPLGIIGLGATSSIYFLDPAWAHYVTVRVSRQNAPEALAHFDAVWRELAPAYPSGRQFLSEISDSIYRPAMAVMALLAGLAFFALVIAAMGLFGMAVHVSERRTHEIGVRKVLGARASQIVFLLMRDFSKPVVIANLIAWPVAFLAGKLYLNLFVDRTTATLAPYAWSLLITLVIAWLAIVGQTLRASRVKPGSVLRYE